METSVFMVNKLGTLLQFDISDHVRQFNSTLFVYLTNIQEIDVHGCRFLDPNLFVDRIVFVRNLKKLIMRSCTQFNEMHFIKMLLELLHLLYVDLASCQQISFDVALCLTSELPQLMFINFEPKNSKEDVCYWEMLLRTFNKVHFGHNVRVCMPHYGNIWRLPHSSDDDSQ